ncbi:hypothetical protein BT96DRAFT_938935 [Gymnopus androsaceus JB14]|uniref:Uncharacterized protein n=1 Tax=Gymnopus androsaceus JB14 TaxID=1447944 RepID=A0A6A4HNJ2_9AGAR|nr:hypothetical protein BT96DRAFT_938935 [Gymnopus androsaceus JB14]
MSRWPTSKVQAETDNEFHPSPALSKSANTVASSSLSRAPRRTAAVVPVIETQRSLTAGQTSRLTAGRSGLSSLTLPAVRGGARGAAGPSRGLSAANMWENLGEDMVEAKEHLPLALAIVPQIHVSHAYYGHSPWLFILFIAFSNRLTHRDVQRMGHAVQKRDSHMIDTRLISFWFLWTVFLQGIFACAEHQSKCEDLEISLVDWVAFFDKYSPRMVAYKAKYGKYIATTWSAAFLLGIQWFCMQMLGQYAWKDLKCYQVEWFIKEAFLTYTFIGGDEIPGLSSPVVTPSELISGSLVNYNQFMVDFELSMSGLDQDKLFPEEAIFISDLIEDVSLSQVGVHGFSPSKRLFDLSEDTLVNNMFINFEAEESEDKNQTDNAQEEEEEEEEEEDADDKLGVKEDPSRHVNNEVEFVGKAVEQPVRSRSSMLKYPTLPVPKPISSSTYTSKSKKGQSSHDKDSGFPRLEGGCPNMSLFGYNSVLARGGASLRAARTSKRRGTPYPETKGVRMITERFAAPAWCIAPFLCNLYPVERADEERRRLFMHAARSNTVIQASNVARRQAQLRNSASDPRSLLKALIEDGHRAAPTQSQTWSHPSLVLFVDLSTRVKARQRPWRQLRGGSAPEEASTVVASLSRLLESSEESEEEAVVHAFLDSPRSAVLHLSSPAPRKMTNQWPSVQSNQVPCRGSCSCSLASAFFRQNAAAGPSARPIQHAPGAHRGSGSKQGSRKRKRPFGASIGL